MKQEEVDQQVYTLTMDMKFKPSLSDPVLHYLFLFSYKNLFVTDLNNVETKADFSKS